MIAALFPFSRATVMLDAVAAAMVLFLPVLGWSIYLARSRKRYTRHKTVQLSLAVLLLVTITLFELDLRLNDWRQRASVSPYYDTILFPVLYGHLVFAISTVVLWIYTIVGALRGFARTPQPGIYSSRHKRVARLAAVDMCCTTISGWVFYIMAFVI